MRPVSLAPAARRLPRRRPAPRIAGTLLAAALLSAGAATPGTAACPWIVQPFVQGSTFAAEPRIYDIVFDGLDQRTKVFYGFTVTSVDLAWELAKAATLPELGGLARPLEATTLSNGGIAYEVAADSVDPHTIYLVTANTAIDELERIEARIEPGRTMAVSELTSRTRGATDLSGPLPPRSLPGFEIISAGPETSSGGMTRLQAEAPSVQICAYQVAMR